MRGAKRNKGWSKEAIEKYNKLQVKVKRQRQTAQHGRGFEEKLRRKMIGDSRERTDQQQGQSNVPEAINYLDEFSA